MKRSDGVRLSRPATNRNKRVNAAAYRAASRGCPAGRHTRPLKPLHVNILHPCREDPIRGSGFVRRILFSRSGARVPAFPPVSQPDDKVSYPMTTYTKIPLDRVFVSPSTPSFSELIDRLQSSDIITSARRKDLIRGLRRVAEALNLTHAQVLADPRWLQPRLARIAPAALRVSSKTWQNIVSNACSAMVA